ncbi:heavy-metal-associated domain-containing protein [Spiroplasma sp. SV19]|uniref:heavy-metal-associated domain-containing protein n=1 Tax=Spiroplasma sp. SV19 TaxID=2570468 RepID=UPI0024B6C3A4|nr:heavy-metal-associated domain-containing protein [Spiroplasma sp. SV19]WHQ36666.1 copper chaperone [Spiroplasma sp. SV19]
MTLVKIHVPELTCSSCAMAIEKKLKKIPHIEFQIGVVTRTVKITYDETLVSKEAVLQQIKKAGYDFDEVATEQL